MNDVISQEKIENGTFAVENEKKEAKKSKKKLNAKKIKVLIAIVLGNFVLGSCYSIMAPIFPPKAEEKNASPTAYGFVFGIYQLTLFLSSPVYGKLISILKPKFMMKAGMLLAGVCNILFGFLDYAPPGPAFIGLALTIRFFNALGASAYLTASYTTLATELSDIIGRAMSLTETAFALGLTGGPVFGGFFFELGGFQLPFIVIGLILIGVTVINMFLFSKDEHQFVELSYSQSINQRMEDLFLSRKVEIKAMRKTIKARLKKKCDIPRQTISFLELIKDIDFMIDVIAISSGFALLTFNETSLEPHIRQLTPSPVTIGLVFLASGLTDAVCAPVLGYIAEKVPNAQYLTFLGSLMSIISFLIVGPASFLNFETVLWVVIVSQVLLGLAGASFIVCSLTHGMKHTVKTGFPDEVGTYGVVSSVLVSAACFGGFVGPSLGGFLIDEIGYIAATMVAAGLGTMVAVICAVRLTHLFFKKRKNTS